MHLRFRDVFPRTIVDSEESGRRKSLEECFPHFTLMIASLISKQESVKEESMSSRTTDRTRTFLFSNFSSSRV